MLPYKYVPSAKSKRRSFMASDAAHCTRRLFVLFIAGVWSKGRLEGAQKGRSAIKDTIGRLLHGSEGVTVRTNTPIYLYIHAYSTYVGVSDCGRVELLEMDRSKSPSSHQSVLPAKKSGAQRLGLNSILFVLSLLQKSSPVRR